jgi:hypothetical protein
VLCPPFYRPHSPHRPTKMENNDTFYF